MLFARIRLDILTGARVPGSRLRFAELLRAYECSAGSLREVLQRLTDAGLVESEGLHGFRVAPLSDDDLEELVDARLEVEVATFRRSLMQGGVSWEGDILVAHHVLDRLDRADANSPGRVSEAWAEAHAAFHLALLSGCENRRLFRFAASLRDSAEVYRRWSVPNSTSGVRDSREEHRAILAAALDRDVELAVSLLRTHIRRSTYELLPMPDSPAEVPASA